MNRIYLDHAATTPLDSRVLKQMLPYLTEYFGNADSPHATGRRAMQGVDRARDSLAQLLHAKPSELYFTSGGTEADNWAFRGGAYAQKECGKTHVILSAIEHHAMLSSAKQLEKEGFDVTYLPVNEGGMVEVNALKEAITPNTGLVAVMYANNETGAVQPIQELASVAHEHGCVFFTDAVQAAPYLELNVRELGVDMLSMSSHKFYGPKGCGVLYMKSGTKMQGLIVGGEQERGLRGGTTNVPNVVGAGFAYELVRAELSQTQERLRTLRRAFLKELKDLEGVHLQGEGLDGILNLRFEGVSGVDFVYAMDLKGVSVATGSACASASVQPSHVLLAMGLTEGEARECVRFSFGKENTLAEILEGAKRTKEVVAALRNR